MRRRRPGCSHRQVHAPTSARSVSPRRRSSTASSTTRRGPGDPLPLDGWISYNPMRGEAAAEKTQVWVGYDAEAVYFAFRCLDTQPDKIRTTISRRDNAFSDDWVGVSLDSSRAGQLAYHLFVNPSGIQMDALQSGSSGRRFCARLGMAERRACRRRRLVGGDPRTARKHPLSERRRRSHGRAVLAAAQPHWRLGIVARNAPMANGCSSPTRRSRSTSFSRGASSR